MNFSSSSIAKRSVSTKAHRTRMRRPQSRRFKLVEIDCKIVSSEGTGRLAGDFRVAELVDGAQVISGKIAKSIVD